MSDMQAPNALIVHGTCSPEEYYSPDYPLPVNSHWILWLQNQLIVRGIHAVALEMPKSYMPHYPTWKREFERFNIGPTSILVGHSCGAGFLVRWLSEATSVRVGKLVLVAPWFDPEQTRGKDNDFFHFQMDQNPATHNSAITVLNSTDDMSAVQVSVERIMSTIRNVSLLRSTGGISASMTWERPHFRNCGKSNLENRSQTNDLHVFARNHHS